MSGALGSISFQRILEDTERHYRDRGGMERKKAEQGPGRELSMYLQGEEGEEEVLWMRVGIWLSGGKLTLLPSRQTSSVQFPER